MPEGPIYGAFSVSFLDKISFQVAIQRVAGALWRPSYWAWILFEDVMASACKRRRWVKVIMVMLLLSAVYLLGAVTVYKQFFPFNQIVSLRNYLSGASLQPNPFWPERREQFLMYSHPADVVMIGDSITHAGHWEDIFPGVKIANRGVGSDKTYDVLQRMDSIYSVRPSKAFLMIGTNDFSVERSVDAVFSDYVSIVQALQDHKIEVYIQSTLECSVRVCGDRLYKIREFNRELESFADSEKLIYIDINARMTSESDGLLAPYTYDGVHLLGKGYAEWRSAIASYIEAK